MRQLVVVLLGLVLCAPCGTLAAEPEGFPDITNTSFVEPNGDRTLQVSIVIAATPAKVFAAFSSPEGWKDWAAPFAVGEARVGGIIETSYDAAAKPGDAGNIKNQIVAWLPGRLVVMKNIKAPADFKAPELYQRTVTIIELSPDGEDATKVTLSGVGFGPGPDFDEIYTGFSWGNSYSLENLKRAIETGPIDWAAEAKKDASP